MNQKTGIVLEGGAMRGLFSAGVLDVMMENGIEFDAVMGVSAGAVFGCNFKSGQIGRSIRYNMRFCDDPRYCSLESLRKTGDLYGVQFCYDEIPNKLDPFDKEAYRSNPMPFYAVCTNVETGKAIHKRLDNGDAKDMEYFRASASMPVVSRIVEVDGYKLLDGGITDSIPLASMERRGYKRNVVVLTQPLGFVKKKSKMIPLIRLTMHQYPNVIRAMEVRHIRYNKQTAYVREQELAGNAFVIRPPHDLGISRTEDDPAELRRVYELGRKEMEERLPELRKFLEKSRP
ncbi:MAG: patatin family protein [Lachnospiraceae bacterium]|nr:patatin family protein [Lachnospiraceae bacterium]